MWRKVSKLLHQLWTKLPGLAQFVPLFCTKNSSKSIRFFSDAWNFITPINQFAKSRETRTEIEKKQIKIKKKARCFKSFFLPFSTFSPTNANNTHIIGFFFNIKETKTNIKSQNLCYHFDHFWTFLGKQIFPDNFFNVEKFWLTGWYFW